MKKLSSKGFSAIEALLILVIIGMIGGVGYYVYTQNKAATKDNTAQDGSTKTSQKNPDKEEDKTSEYKNETLGFSFKYPKNWSKETEVIEGHFKDNLVFKSPDYKPVPDGPFGEVEAGGIIRVQVSKTDYKTTKEAKENDPYAASPEDITVAGVAAVREVKCGHPTQQSTCIYFVKDGLYYSLSYKHTTQETSDNAKYKAEFNQLIESFEFL